MTTGLMDTELLDLGLIRPPAGGGVSRTLGGGLVCWNYINALAPRSATTPLWGSSIVFPTYVYNLPYIHSSSMVPIVFHYHVLILVASIAIYNSFHSTSIRDNLRAYYESNILSKSFVAGEYSFPSSCSMVLIRNSS